MAINKVAIKRLISDLWEDYRLARRKKGQIQKFRDPRRMGIAHEFPLTVAQKQEIDDFFISNYGEKLDYVWHQNYAAHAGKFDSKFFPELLYIPEFESFQNINHAAVEMIGDKNFLPLIADSVGVKMPQTIMSCTNGLLRDADNRLVTEKIAFEILTRQKDFFIKPSVDTCSGQGCKRLNVNDILSLTRNGLLLKSGRGGILITLLYKNLSFAMRAFEPYTQVA